MKKYLGPSKSRKASLHKVADKQYGYFTAAQAVFEGYTDKNHGYHVKNGDWSRVSAGLYRLCGYPDSMEADFAQWSLWSRNQKDQPQGVISHESAMAFYGLAEYRPSEIHMTVAGRFQKKIPQGIVIHKASLNLSVIDHHGAFMTTGLAQTLVDMCQELEAKGEWEIIVQKAVDTGKLSWDEIADLKPNGNNVTVKNRDIDKSVSAPAPEGVWNMIFDNTEALRRRSRAGFTLVELLVVIAIISILAAMLMPALGKAMESARQVECTNHMKQISIAYMCYIDENKGYLPPYNDYAPNWLKWQSHLYAIMHDISTFNQGVHRNTDGTPKAPFRCPSQIDAATNKHYGQNYYFHEKNVYYNYRIIKKTSQRLLITDSSCTDTFVTTGYVDGRHNGKANILYADCHTGSSHPKMLPSWNGDYLWGWNCQ